MKTRTTRRRFLGAGALALTCVLAGCSTGSPADGSAAAGNSGATTSLTVAFDWYNNNSTFAGFYAAEKNGYYAAAGLDVKILPYTTTSSEVMVSSGQAQFGTKDQIATQISQAAGAKITAIAAISQHLQDVIAVAPKDNEIVKTPADLSGKVYGGFGSDVENLVVKTMIANAGGDPTFTSVTLGANAYDELNSGEVDFAIPYVTEDALWQKLAGKPWKTFSPLDYGFPDTAGKLLIGNNDYMQKNPKVTQAFVTATMRGYQWAQQHPDEAVDVMSAADVGPFDSANMKATAQMLAKDYWLPHSGPIGSMNPQMWQKFAAFATNAGLFKDADAKTISSVPDVSAWFTNQYVSGGS